MYFVFSVEEYLEEVDNANPTMETIFESVCGSVSWNADRKLAYGLVKNTLYFCTGPTGSATGLIWFFKNTVYTLILIDLFLQRTKSIFLSPSYKIS